MRRPETHFTKAGDVSLAYQVVGDGPVDLVFAFGWLHNIDLIWEHPAYRQFLQTLASFSRLILFDKRGTGLSDRNTGAATLEERAEDIRAVMDAVGCETASILGQSEGGHMAAMFAACYPERTRSIILLDTRPCVAWKLDWPYGMRLAEYEEFLGFTLENWGQPVHLGQTAPSIAGNPEEEAWYTRMLMHAGSPSSAAAHVKVWYGLDVRAVLPAIQCPALVCYRRGDLSVQAEEVQYFKEHIPNAKLVEIEGNDHWVWAGDQSDCLRKISEFVAAEQQQTTEDRVLLSVLMSDIVGSTNMASKLGDAEWRRLLTEHDARVAIAIGRHQGQFVKSTGDGVLATFAGPSRAIACAQEMHSDAKKLDLKLRAGIHTGECLRYGSSDVTGLGVTIASRIMDQANACETLVSSTVSDLVVGSGLKFTELGRRALKGVPGDWCLARVDG